MDNENVWLKNKQRSALYGVLIALSVALVSSTGIFRNHDVSTSYQQSWYSQEINIANKSSLESTMQVAVIIVLTSTILVITKLGIMWIVKKIKK